MMVYSVIKGAWEEGLITSAENWGMAATSYIRYTLYVSIRAELLE